jgi:transposase
VAPHARRSTRLREVVRLVAVALGGEAGARLIDRLGMPTSPSTLLRAIRQAVRPTEADPRGIGIDDCALRRGQRYGTVIVDRAQGDPVALLPDRSAPTVASWLAAHSGVAVITRDRSTEYARAIATGAPQAVEVLDRWHVHKNVREAVERFLSRHQHSLGAIILPEWSARQAVAEPAAARSPPRAASTRQWTWVAAA